MQTISDLVNEKMILDSMPTMSDQQVCIIYKKAPWRSDLWEKAVEQLRHRGISPRMINEIMEKVEDSHGAS